ncbi:MAG: DNA repair protein RecN, partial [Fidelibacterota bacterium]
IFDEIDTGISGSTANQVARVLHDLSRSKQVLCITHLPQIVRVADHHLHVTKSVGGERTQVTFNYLSRENGRRVIEELTGSTAGN